MTKEQEDKIISAIITALGTYALCNIKDSRNIHKPPININMMLATFILCSCLIDQMAQIRYYKKPRNPVSQNFKDFVTNYFNDTRYDPEQLHGDLRSRLVHNYSVTGKYWLADDRTYRHLEPVNGRIYLNIDDFILDIEIVWEKFKTDLLTNADTRQHAILHEGDYPILKQGNI